MEKVTVEYEPKERKLDALQEFAKLSLIHISEPTRH